MSPNRTSLRALGAVIAASALLPATALAQNCLGFRLSGGQHAVGTVIDERGEFGGIGGWYAGTLRNGTSLHADFTKHDVEMGSGSAEYEQMTMGTVRVSGPVLRKQSVNDNPNGLCIFAELGFSSFQESSSNSFGLGLGYAMNMKRLALFVGPVIGQARSGDYSDSYVNVVANAMVRLGFFTLGFQTTQPMQPEGAQSWGNLRMGIAFGRESQVKEKGESPSRGSAIGDAAATGLLGAVVRQGAAQAGQPAGATAAAAPQGAPGPTPGLNPYTLEDIEAMVGNGVTATRILELSYKACLNFKVDAAAETKLRRVGADQALIDGLKTRCYSAS